LRIFFGGMLCKYGFRSSHPANEECASGCRSEDDAVQMTFKLLYSVQYSSTSKWARYVW
jgi:hypothetical protein